MRLHDAGRGWLRVEPDPDGPTHDEQHRRHEGHRHRRTGSSDAASTASENWSGASEPAAPSQPQSLDRVAQEVYGRLVSGPRKPANGLWRSSVPDTKASGSSGASGGQGSNGWPAGSGFVAAGHTAGRDSVAPHPPRGQGQPIRHRKTMSLDTGTAAAAQEAAAAALLERQRKRQQGPAAGSKGAGAGSPPLPPSWSQRKQVLERRPSDVASAAAMASMRRTEHRVRAPSRLACFGGCRRQPAVKE